MLAMGMEMRYRARDRCNERRKKPASNVSCAAHPACVPICTGWAALTDNLIVLLLIIQSSADMPEIA
jgi:hypothetical protein